MADETNGRPAQPTLPQAEIDAVVASFKDRICPLSIIGLTREPQGAGLVTPLGNKASTGPEVTGCQGPACMWFKVMHTPDGRAVGGDCSVGLIANGLGAAPIRFAEVLSQLGKFRFTPNGG